MASVILTVIFLSAALFAILNRTGILILLWKETELSSITHDDGYGYYAYVPDENVSRLALPVFLKEDSSFPDPGPLSVNEDLTAAIKENGGGRWQMQKNNDLYFSATDNQPKQHEYSILSPLIIRGRYLLLIIVVMLVILAANLFVWLKHKDMQYLRSIVRGLTAICFFDAFASLEQSNLLRSSESCRRISGKTDHLAQSNLSLSPADPFGSELAAERKRQVSADPFYFDHRDQYDLLFPPRMELLRSACGLFCLSAKIQRFFDQDAGVSGFY